MAILAFAGSASAVDSINFEQQIAPILEQHCLRCHSPGIRKGDISLATIDDLKENDFLAAGDPDNSHLLNLIAGSADEPPQMPKDAKRLETREVDLVRQWIREGAKWPKGTFLRERSKANASWWSLQSLSEEFSNRTESETIDTLVRAKLAERGLTMNPSADKRSLIRRATYDLTGLPPSPEEVEAFVKDSDPQAYEMLLDRLLASPGYGERWGRHWLDVVRFGESNGFERNVVINELWPFRDYVISSLNDDKPFDQFIREHIAGDVIGKDQPEIEVGSAFLVAGPYDNVGNQDAIQAAQIRADTIDEMIRSTSEAFLGLTVGCARCHDHKFDPIRQSDYYSMYSTFAAVRHGIRELGSAEDKATRAAELPPLQARKADLEKRKTALSKAKPQTDRQKQELTQLNEQLAAVNKQLAKLPTLQRVWVGTRNANEAKGPFQVFLGGSPQRRGETVSTASLAAFSKPIQSRKPRPQYSLAQTATEAERRMALADWIASSQNPLTLRVLANRVWHYHFGTGLVDTPSDFGYMGGRPTHPKLLDWLAVRLREAEWKLKPFHKLVMMSETYRQSSGQSAEAARVDSDSRLLWRFPPRRLSAEEIRDTILLVAGKLDLKMGGPGFRLYEYQQDNVATYVPLDQHPASTYRRAVYHQNARASVVDLMTDFDQPDCAFSTPRRAETTTPLQALTMLNHSFTLEMARFLAERVQSDAPNDHIAQIQRVYQLCYSREPTKAEADACLPLVARHGLPAFCRVMLNTGELIYVK